jgi:hypothetical protein
MAGRSALSALVVAALTIGLVPAAGAATRSVAVQTAAASQTPVIAYDAANGVYVSHDDGTLPVLVAGTGTEGPAVSLDGRTIAYRKSTSLWVVGPTGAGRHQVGTGAAPTQFAVSPDGSKIVGVRGGVLVEITVATGVAATVPGSTGETAPFYSPDGKTIAAKPASGAGTVFHTGSVRTVKPTVRPGEYSPNGTMLLSVIRPAGTVVASKVDGSGSVTIGTSQWAVDAHWLPSSGSTLYAAVDEIVNLGDPKNERTQVVRMRVGGTAVVLPLPYGVMDIATGGLVGRAGYTLTAAAHPATVLSGQRVQIQGTLRVVGSGAPMAGASIQIWRRRTGSAAPTMIGTVPTNAKGAYTVLQIPGNSYDFDLRYAGTAGTFVPHAFVSVRVASRVTSNVFASSSAPAGTKVNFTAATSPWHVWGKTYLQRRSGTTAVNVGPHNTDHYGKVVYSVAAPARGTSQYYRVLVPASSNFGFASAGPWTPITGR